MGTCFWAAMWKTTSLLVGDVGQHQLGFGHLEPDLVEEGLLPVEHHQPGGAVGDDLPHGLAADRPAGTRDEDGGTGQVGGDLVGVDRGVRSAEEVGEVEVPQAPEQVAVDALRGG
jgi:hypothetical protein